jgi:hypothetical protein
MLLLLQRLDKSNVADRPWLLLLLLPCCGAAAGGRLPAPELTGLAPTDREMRFCGGLSSAAAAVLGVAVSPCSSALKFCSTNGSGRAA